MATIQYRGCSLSPEIATDLARHQEAMAAQVAVVRTAALAAQGAMAASAAAGAAVTQQANLLLAGSRVQNVPGFLGAIGVRRAALTRGDAEAALLDSQIVMINGKILPLDTGHTLDDIRVLWDAVDQNLLRTKDLLVGKPLGDFVFIVRYRLTSTTAGVDGCGADVLQSNTVDLLGGVDQTPAAVLPGGLEGAEVARTVVWLGHVGATRPALLRLQALGLSAAEIQAVLAGLDAPGIRCVVIDDPTLLRQLQTAASAQLTDLDLTTLLERRDIPDVLATFAADAIVSAVDRALRAGLRGRTPDGFKSYQAAAVLLAQTIDVRRSFSVDAMLAGLPPDPQAAACGAYMDAATTAAQQGIGEIAALAPTLNQTFETMAVVDNLFDTSPLDVLLCLLGFNLSFGVSISFDAMIAAIKAFVATIRAVIDALIAVIAAFSALVCLITSVLNFIPNLINGILACFNGPTIPTIPDFLSGVIAAMISALQTVQAMVDAIGTLIISFLSFSIGLSVSAKATAAKHQNSCLLNSGIVLKLTISSL